jgi:hypothetical protein
MLYSIYYQPAGQNGMNFTMSDSQETNVFRTASADDKPLLSERELICIVFEAVCALGRELTGKEIVVSWLTQLGEAKCYGSGESRAIDPSEVSQLRSFEFLEQS